MDYIYRYPFFRIALFFAISIIFVNRIFVENVDDIFVFVSIISFLSALLGLLLKKWIRFGLVWIWGIFGLILIFCIGLVQVQLSDERLCIDHWQHYLDSNSSSTLLLELKERPVLKRDKFRFVAEVIALKHDSNFIPVRGKLLVYLKADDVNGVIIDYGTRLLVSGICKPLEGPINPFGFNPKEYFGNQGVFYSLRLGSKNWLYSGRGKVEWYMNLANRASDYLSMRFKMGGLSGREYSVATALVFGLRNEMDMEVISAFSASGAMHILSVSGMHVGMIYLALQFLLKVLDKRRWSKIVKSILILLMLWFYSLVSGLTPSVLRSSLMLSFILLGELLGRRQHAVNTLCMVGFMLMLYDIRLLFNVGFQLSFVAVLGILLWYQKLYSLVFFRWKLLDWIWSVSAVSLVATSATLPFCLYYFHQFPNYFLLSNYLVIPVSNLVIYLGIALSVFGFIPWFSYWIGKALNWAVWLLNKLVFLIEGLPGAVTKGIVWDRFDLILFYLFLIGLLILLKRRSSRSFLAWMSFLWLVLLVKLLVFCSDFKTPKMVFYKGNGDLVQGILEGREEIYLKPDGAKEISGDQMSTLKLMSTSNHVLSAITINENLELRPRSGYRLCRMAGKVVCFIWGNCRIKQRPPSSIDILYLQRTASISGLENLEDSKISYVVLGNGLSKKKSDSIIQKLNKFGVKVVDLREGGRVVSFP